MLDAVHVHAHRDVDGPPDVVGVTKRSFHSRGTFVGWLDPDVHAFAWSTEDAEDLDRPGACTAEPVRYLGVEAGDVARS